MSGALEVGAEKRDRVESFLGEEAELVREYGEDGRDIHQTLVVGDEDVARRGIEFLQAFDAHANEAGGEEYPPPNAREIVLRVSRAVEERGNNRERPHHYGGDDNDRSGNQEGPKETHSLCRWTSNMVV